MTALKHDAAPPDHRSVRPAWVTDEVLDRLTGRVFRDAGNAAPTRCAPSRRTTARSTADDPDEHRRRRDPRRREARRRCRRLAQRARTPTAPR